MEAAYFVKNQVKPNNQILPIGTFFYTWFEDNSSIFWDRKSLEFNKKKTRPSSDSEAATMYKLKGKSLNMQTGQGFK